MRENVSCFFYDCAKRTPIFVAVAFQVKATFLLRHCLHTDRRPAARAGRSSINPTQMLALFPSVVLFICRIDIFITALHPKDIWTYTDLSAVPKVHGSFSFCWHHYLCANQFLPHCQSKRPTAPT